MKYYLNKTELLKRKNEKMKKSPKNIESFTPHPPGGGQHSL
jgi:hypothetical protein